MKFAQNKAVYQPVSVTFETQDELNRLANALYEIELNDFEDIYQDILREFRVALQDFNTSKWE